MILMSNCKKGCNGDSESRLSNCFPFLPCDIIIYDILTRVPIDSLILFKSVCKSWSSLTINDSEFINIHSRRQTHSNRGFIWLSKNYTAEYSGDDSEDDDSKDDDDPNLSSLVFFDIDKKERKVFKFRPESGLLNTTNLFIRDSLNGFVLLSCQHKSSRSYHVYNPITGYSYRLPVGNVFVRGHSDNLYFYLVYDLAVGKYKVLCVRLNLSPTRSRSTNQFSLKIITLNTGNDSWREVDFPKMRPLLDDFRQVFANGSYNWLTYEKEILSIDVCNEIFQTIKYPKGGSTRSKLLEVEGGSLGFVDYTDNSSVAYKGKLRLWVFKEDEEIKKNGHQPEWMQMYNIVDMFNNTSVPGTFTRSGSSIVIIAVVMHPTPMIILGVSLEEFEDDGGIHEYYSYDVKLKSLDSIVKPYEYNKWHVSSLARL